MSRNSAQIDLSYTIIRHNIRSTPAVEESDIQSI